MLVQMVVKCADIGHLAAAPRTHKRWATQLEEEFFRQVLCCAVLLCCAISCSAVLCCAVLRQNALNEAMLGCTVLYRAAHSVMLNNMLRWWRLNMLHKSALC